MKQPGKFEVRWVDRGRPPQCPPDPLFPKGRQLNLTLGESPSCHVELPYPCPHENIGLWMVRCLTCGLTCGITAASRADDPRSAEVACKVHGTVQ